MTNAFGEQFCGDAGDRAFTGGIDVQHGHRISIVKRGGKVIEEQLRSRITVGLEDNVNAPKAALARGGQSGAYLRGMVAVVVDHGDAIHPAFELKATVHSVEVRQSFANLVDGNVESEPDGDGCGGVANVVFAGHMELKFAEVAALIFHSKNTGCKV